MWNPQLATLALSALALGDVQRPPQAPPHFEDEGYVESLLERFRELRDTGSYAEIQRARAKVNYYLHWLELEETLEQAAEAVARTEREIDSLRASGVTRFGRIEAELSYLRERHDDLSAILRGDATADQWAQHVGAEEVPDFFFPLAPNAAGELRPEPRMMEGTIDKFAPLVAYSGELDAAKLRPVQALAQQHRQHALVMPASEWALLQEISNEAGRCLALLEAGNQAEARAIADARWAWVLAWGDEATPTPALDVPAPEVSTAR